MRLIRLDGSQMTDKKAAHTYLQKQLNLKGYVGHNLDALFDVLTTVNEPMEIMIIHKKDMTKQLGGYADKVIRTFKDATTQNSLIVFKII